MVKILRISKVDVYNLTKKAYVDKTFVNYVFNDETMHPHNVFQTVRDNGIVMYQGRRDVNDENRHEFYDVHEKILKAYKENMTKEMLTEALNV